LPGRNRNGPDSGLFKRGGVVYQPGFMRGDSLGGTLRQ